MKLSLSIIASLTFAASFAALPAYAQTVAPSSTSGNWSGYAATGETYTGIGGSWAVSSPSATADTLAADASWIGIGGVSSENLIQAGTQSIVQNGTVTYQAWYETLPQSQKRIPVAVHAGDTVRVALRETATNTWHLSFTNTTTGATYDTDISYDSSHASAEWIQEMPTMITNSSSGYITLDQFGTVPFTNAYAVTANGIETLAQTNPMPVTMLSGRSILANPSNIGSDGESFSVSRSNATANTATMPAATIVRVNRTGEGVRGFIPGQHAHIVRTSQTSTSTSYSYSYSSNGATVHVQFQSWGG